MKKHFFRDELQKLIFPWLTPHPVSSGADVGCFQETITGKDYLVAAKRNQVGFNIIYNVAQDAVTCGFRCVDENEEILRDFDKQVSKIYLKEVEEALLNAFASARLYGSAGILIGFEGSSGLSVKRKYGAKVSYLYALPETLVLKKNPKKDTQGQTEFPLELANYKLRSYKNQMVDGSRLVHIQPFTIEPDLDGTSVLESVYDLLTVLKNADWSVGQNIFRHSSGLTFITPGDGASQAQIDAIRDVTGNTNAKSIVTLIPGCTTTSVQASSLNPGQYYDVLMGQISAGCNIPVSILTGAQSGQGVSENDRRDYADFLTGIQKSCLTPALKKILNIYQESKQLPKHEFEIRWNSRSIFMIEAARAKLYNARSEVEKEKKRETEAKASLFSARADYWKALGERKQETYEEAKELEEKEEEEEERTDISLSKRAAEMERSEAGEV